MFGIGKGCSGSDCFGSGADWSGSLSARIGSVCYLGFGVVSGGIVDGSGSDRSGRDLVGVGRDRDGTEGWGSERIGVGFEHTPVRIGLLLRIQVSPGWGRSYQRFKGYLVIIN